ncbi:MAG: hypothetical protein DME74_10590 [Verrucomicrobia bacterium]|nr:MAG: hypothetical protein DME74_10590 [Verrucomicrobiota bacterium]
MIFIVNRRNSFERRHLGALRRILGRNEPRIFTVPLDANRATRTRVKNFGFLFGGYTYPEADDKRNNQQHCRQIISIHPKLITFCFSFLR